MAKRKALDVGTTIHVHNGAAVPVPHLEGRTQWVEPGTYRVVEAKAQTPPYNPATATCPAYSAEWLLDKGEATICAYPEESKPEDNPAAAGDSESPSDESEDASPAE